MMNRAVRQAGVVTCPVLAVVALAVFVAKASAAGHTCADYQTQAQAQAPADTVDADHDGIYCEGLPCPCSHATGGGDGSSQPGAQAAPTAPAKQRCSKPKAVVSISFSRPAIRPCDATPTPR